jgi:hypothetical protein
LLDVELLVAIGERDGRNEAGGQDRESGHGGVSLWLA